MKASFTNHNAYVEQITALARELQAQRYLLKADANAIIRAAIESNIGNP